MSEPTMRDDHPRRGELRQIPTADNATTLVYAPERDGLADAGEIVWTWVPYEEDPGQGKDRPLLVIGRRQSRLHGLMLSSRRPSDRERQDWLPIGSGPWDRERRDSYLRVDRLFEFDEEDIRREAAVMDEDLFWKVAAVLRARYGWR
ncbi:MULTISPECIES: type II toxin-antitoxin system PemK/MazF family toxin [unclassified Nocardiopsis]|uniref:type II toxin-antitoxin system PemK/MazF family toxin n=1 Tax=unclassified Nocardiopsis TaxID=2649073 RepID=UPI001356BDBB|nr:MULTISPECIES: type II toxin-antitoxin system PemK/MazF family toxin [unclassified Nocardiopsis]